VTDDQLTQLYEKLYFQEIEAREKIHSRLQLPLTLIVAIVGALMFLIQNFEYDKGPQTASRTMFTFFIFAASATLVSAIVFFINALYNNAYYFLPDSAATANYRVLLEQTYRAYEQRKQLVEDALGKYITDYYIQYAAFNTKVNDRRSGFLHYCNGAIVGTAMLLFFAFLCFYFGGLDRNKTKNATEVQVNKPVEVRIIEQRR
jgi:uncharacterized protein with PQ loop repeat